jgi:hypothetical protein
MSIALLFVISCMDNTISNKDRQLKKKIVALHKKAKNIAVDSLYLVLRKADSLLHQMYVVPDSIFAEQSFLQANYYREKQQLDSAIYYYKLAIVPSGDSIRRKREIGYFQNLYITYDENDDYLNSLSIANKLEELLLNTNYYKEIAYVYSYKRMVRIKLKNYLKALALNNQEIVYFKKAKDTANVFMSQIVRAKLMYDYLGRKERAFALLDSLKRSVPDIGYKDVLEKDIYLAFGVYKYYDKEYKVSYANYLEALKYTKRINNAYSKNDLGVMYSNIAEVLMMLHKTKLGKQYLDSASTYLSDMSMDNRKFYMQLQSRLSYQLHNDFDEVYANYDKLFDLLNKSYNKRITTELNELKEANAKEKELILQNQSVVLNNVKLKRKQTLLSMLLALLFFSVLISILFYRQYKFKNEKEQLLMQQRLFRVQMNPHFTSNILFSIQKLFSIDEQKANQYIVKFSRLLRLNLKNSLESFIPLEDEEESVEKYLDLQLLRYPNLYSYSIEKEGFDFDTYYTVPPMIIQPFVENCVLHAFNGIDYKGEIKILLKVDGNFIQCTIEDNGVGLTNANSKNGHISMSTNLIKKLLKQMTNKDVVFIDKRKSNLGRGLLVKFYIPYKYD